MNKETIKRILSDNDTVLWALTFVGVCVLVGLGKLDQIAVTHMMMAIVGRASVGGSRRTQDAAAKEAE